jgi:hypothetical protein
MKSLINKIKNLWRIDEIKIFIITFVLHESVVLFLHFYSINIYGFYNDDSDYNEFALQIANLINSGNYFIGAVYSFHWYPFFVGIIYWIFGPIKLLTLSFNAILISFSAVLLFRIINFINFNKENKVSFWFSLFIMNASMGLMYFSSLLLKEAWIIFLILLFFYIGLLLICQKNNFYFRLVLLIIIFILLFYLRFFIAYAVLGGLFIAWILNNYLPINVKIFKGAIMFFLFSVIIFLLNGGHIGSFNIRNDNSLSPLNIVRTEFVGKIRTSYFVGGNLTTNIKITQEDKNKNEIFNIKAIIKSSINTAVGPLPWQISIKKYLMIFPEILIWYIVLFFTFIGINKIKTKTSVIFIVSAFIVFAGLSMAVDNFGALVRYRLSVFVILSILSYFGLLYTFNNFKK